MSINIGNSIDPFYRYQRPISIVKIINGKTKIINLINIADALQTKVIYILYFIQLEKSTSVTNTGEIKMIMAQSEIEILINKFINLYIICSECKLPELDIKQNNKKLYYCCRACGSSVNILENKFTKIIYKDHY